VKTVFESILFANLAETQATVISKAVEDIVTKVHSSQLRLEFAVTGTGIISEIAASTAVTMNDVYEQRLSRLPKTIKALDKWDQTEPKRQRMYERLFTNKLSTEDDIWNWVAAEETARLKVCQAYFQDTAERCKNTESACRCIGIVELKRYIETGSWYAGVKLKERS